MREDASNQQPVRRNQLVYDVLRDHLVSDRLPPGLVVTESGVARAFGVSRAPAATALARLEKERLLARFEGRGYLVGRPDGTVIRERLEEAGLIVSNRVRERLAERGWLDRAYSTIEEEIAGCLGYGTFRVVAASLAEHCGMSRMTAQLILSRLERVGLLQQESNRHWMAPQLVADGIADHYAMRRLLEPAALREAAVILTRSRLEAAIGRIEATVQDGRTCTAEDIMTIENDLHRSIVLSCRNQQLRQTIYRSQLPLLATHVAFGRHKIRDEMNSIFDEHMAVFEGLRDGDIDRACRMLVAHIDNGEQLTLRYFETPRPIPRGLVPPYMISRL